MARTKLSILLSGCVAVQLLGASIESLAAPITLPTGLNPGDQYRLTFVTSTTRDATSPNIADYNAFVTGVANGVAELLALGTTWTAIASTQTVDARDNTSTNDLVSVGVPIYLLNDTLIANDNADLWDGTLATALKVTEFADVLSVNSGVWTGTSTTGVVGPFPMGTLFTNVGQTDFSNFIWVAGGNTTSTGAKRIYAISSTLTVIPEPSSALLLASGLAALAVGRRRRAL